jgi:hypothetical protein
LCDGHYDCENGEDERNCGRSWIGKRGAPLYEDKENDGITGDITSHNIEHEAVD